MELETLRRAGVDVPANEHMSTYADVLHNVPEVYRHKGVAYPLYRVFPVKQFPIDGRLQDGYRVYYCESETALRPMDGRNFYPSRQNAYRRARQLNLNLK